MIPKKHKEFIKPTAKKLGISEILVSDLTSFYWSSVRKHLSSLEHHRISIINLGTFHAQYKKLPNILKKYENIYDKLIDKKVSFETHSSIKDIENNIEKLRIMKQVLAEEYQRKQEVKQKRKEHVANKNLER